jgi:hypothetical protein
MFGVSQFEDLEIQNCSIFNIDGLSYAVSKGTNAFSGRVSIKKLWLPRSEGEMLRHHPFPSGTQETRSSHRRMLAYELRNIRYYLTSKGDLVAAGPFYSAEQSLESMDDNSTNWLLGWAYRILSDYGNQILRPFLILVGTILLGIATWSAHPDSLKSVCHSCIDKSVTDPTVGEVARYFFGKILNPLDLGTSSARSIQAVNSMGILYALLGLIETATFALMLLAVRRRFKLEKPGDS